MAEAGPSKSSSDRDTEDLEVSSVELLTSDESDTSSSDDSLPDLGSDSLPDLGSDSLPDLGSDYLGSFTPENVSTDTFDSQKLTLKKKKSNRSSSKNLRRSSSVLVGDMEIDSSKFGSPNVTLGETSSADSTDSGKPTQKKKKPNRLSRPKHSSRSSSKRTPVREKSPPPVTMCTKCVFKEEIPFPIDRDEWPIEKIEIGCFHQICRKLSSASHSTETLMIDLGGFDQSTAAYIEQKYKGNRGLEFVKEVLHLWGSSSKKNNVGALRKILKDVMRRVDVVTEIEKWEKWSVCHGCGVKSTE